MFTIRDYMSDETFDIGKFMNFVGDVYDVLDCPFLAKFKQLPVNRYYSVNSGSREIDLISSEVYGNPFFAFLIQYFNDITIETLPEGTVLKLFSLDDLNTLYYNLSIQSEG